MTAADREPYRVGQPHAGGAPPHPRGRWERRPRRG